MGGDSVNISGEARADHGGVANTGTIYGDITIHQGPVVRSAYREQVQRIAPPTLKDRDMELAELAAFCVDSQAGPYVWWQAPAWAGKSALMSWFVLHPPPGVRVVSFFITARYAGQSDRSAFVDVLMEQLCDLLDRAMPAFLTDATREPHLLALLAEAAEMCRQRSQRLVLVVDGLDEDTGVIFGAQSHSIAAILPAIPRGGMRIIIAGRPHPPMPTDVPNDHPLLSSSIVRELSRSPYAKIVRADAERELTRLMEGTPAEQDLLGLLAAAGGGLSGVDLAELTGWSAWKVDKNLGTVSGRTFTPRTGRWRPGTQVYVLGHEELQQNAVEWLGPLRLKSYRERLHNWAEGYRDRHWPPETPEYLLRGYHRVLHSLGDLPRLLDLALDLDRQKRMLGLTGGDHAALAEIISIQDVILSQTDIDLAAMARLAIHRDALRQRNSHIPPTLPTVWAGLGHFARAEALARSITEPKWQAEALANVAGAVAANDPGRARSLAEQAEATARSITSSYRRTPVLAAVSQAVAAADAERAETLARSDIDGYEQPESLAAMAKAMATTDPTRARVLAEQAESLVRSNAEPARQAWVLSAVAETFAIVDPDRALVLAQQARVLAERAEMLAQSGADPERQAKSSADAARAMATVDPQRALALAERAQDLVKQAMALVHSIQEMEWTEQSLAGVEETLVAAARAMAAVDPQRAAVLARFITNAGQRVEILVAATRAMAAIDPARAQILAEQAEAMARAITDTSTQVWKLSAVALAVAVVDPGRSQALAEQAEALARSITDSYRHEWTLVAVARAAAAVDPERAEMLARSITKRDQQARVLSAVAEAVVAVDPQRAEILACSITSPANRAQVLSAVAHAVAAVDPGRARALAEQAETMAYSIADAHHQAQTLAAVAQAVAVIDPARARALAERVKTTLCSITYPKTVYPSSHIQTVTAVARTLASVDPDQAETLARSIRYGDKRVEALSVVAQTLAAVDPDRAEALARSIKDPRRHAGILAAVAQAVTTAEPARALALAERAETVARSIRYRDERAEALSVVAQTLAAVDPDRAERLAHSITDPEQQTKAIAAIAMKVPPRRGRPLVARALLAGDWETSLAALACVQPTAVNAVVDEALRVIIVR